ASRPTRRRAGRFPGRRSAAAAAHRGACRAGRAPADPNAAARASTYCRAAARGAACSATSRTDRGRARRARPAAGEADRHARRLRSVRWAIASLAATLIAASQSSSAQVQADCDINRLDAPCPLVSGMTVQGTIAESGGRNYYWFGVPRSDMHVRIDLVDLPADYDLYLFSDQSSDPSLPIAGSPNSDATQEVIDRVLSDQGTYLVEVVSDPSLPADPEQPYTLVFALVSPPTPTSTPEPPTPAPTVTPEPRTTVPPVLYHGGGAAAQEV